MGAKKIDLLWLVDVHHAVDNFLKNRVSLDRRLRRRLTVSTHGLMTVLIAGFGPRVFSHQFGTMEAGLDSQAVDLLIPLLPAPKLRDPILDDEDDWRPLSAHRLRKNESLTIGRHIVPVEHFRGNT